MSDDVEYEVETGIVKTGCIDKFEEFDFNGFFDGIYDAETAKSAIDTMTDLENALNLAHKFGEYASQFCLREAQTYVRISCYEGAEAKLKRWEKNLIEWIRGKSDRELDEIYLKCSEGIRINKLRSYESSFSRKEHSESECKRISEKIVSEALETGRTRLSKSRFYEEAKGQGKLDPEVVSAFTEKTRDELLHNKVLGLGDGNGTYITTSICSRKDISKIVGNRLRSVVDDLKSIKQICVENHFFVEKKCVDAMVSLINELGETE